MDLKKLSTFSMICEILYSCVKFYKKKNYCSRNDSEIIVSLWSCTVLYILMHIYVCLVTFVQSNWSLIIQIKFVEHCWGFYCCLNSCRLWELPITWLPRLSKETGQYIWQAMLRKCEKDISNTKEIKMNGINDI